MSTSDDYEEVAHLTQWLKKSRDKHEVLGGLDTNKNPSICERGGDWRECQFWIKERWGFKVSIFTRSSTSKIVRTIAFYFKTI